MKKLFFFIKRAILDVVRPGRFFVSENYQPANEAKLLTLPYLLDYTTKGMVKYYNLNVDADGIVQMSHYIDHNSGSGHYYSPVKIAHYALGAYNDYLKSLQQCDFKTFNKHAHWLTENYTREELGYVWRVPSTNPKYELGINYISAISQGLVLSVIARLYKETNSEAYRLIGEEGLKPFSVPVEDGGLLANGKWGFAYEEYPCEPYSHVMNGFAFCLTGLDDFYRLTGSTEAKRLFDVGIKTFRAMTKDWFYSCWARYDLRDLYTKDLPNLATRHYQYLHADQMEGLFRITQDKYYKDLSRRFLRQVWNPVGFLHAYCLKLRKFL